MTELKPRNLEAHLRLCISMHRHMTRYAHIIEQDQDFKDSFNATLPTRRNAEGGLETVSKLSVAIPSTSAFVGPQIMSLHTVMYEFHEHAKEQKWIEAINDALKDLRTTDHGTLSVSKESAGDGWCSPIPGTVKWEIIRCYELEVAPSASAGLPAEAAGKLPATLFDAVEHYKKKKGKQNRDDDAASMREREALAILASTRMMAVLTVFEK